MEQKIPALEQKLAEVTAANQASSVEAAKAQLRTQRALLFNNRLDAVVAGLFLVLVSAILVLSVREWLLLIGRRKLAMLRETPPVWLPEYAVVESKPLQVMGLVGLGLALAKELSGEAELERVRTPQDVCACAGCSGEAGASGGSQVTADPGKTYQDMLERKYKGIRRCC